MLIPQTVLSRVINAGLSAGADFCEIYAEETLAGFMELKSSRTEYSSGKDMGVGIRLLYGNEELYTYTNSFEEKSLLKALKSLTTVRKKDSKGAFKGKVSFLTTPSTGRFSEELKTGLKSEKLFLQKLDKELRAESASVSQCHLILKRTCKKVQVANSEKLLTMDIRPYFMFRAVSVTEEKGRKETGAASVGRTGDQAFWNEELLKQAVRRSGKEALQNLKAAPAPAGKFPVIINKGFGGVIFHEACGHGMETTSVAENISVFSNKMGKRVAPPCVTAYDDGTIPGEYGSLEKDDEGRRTEKTCLIEKGILKNYMADRMGAKKTSYKTTGSARRQDYKFPPASRMRNTYIAPGDSSIEEMIKDIDFGLFAEKLGGGSVVPETGNYNFSVTSARWIKNGRLAEPVKGVSLIGNGPDTLSKITKVGKELELAPGLCGSISGLVPVTVGQPPLLVSELTVGGQK